MTHVVTVAKWDIDSLSGVWIVIGTFIVYCFACLAIAFRDKWLFRKARRNREKYRLTVEKERENNGNN